MIRILSAKTGETLFDVDISRVMFEQIKQAEKQLGPTFQEFMERAIDEKLARMEEAQSRYSHSVRKGGAE